MGVFREIYEYREMIGSLIGRDLKSRYKGSALGFLWSFLNPLFQLIVYSLVFNLLMGNRYERYYLFLFVALVPWLFFLTSVAGGCSCVWAQKDLVNKIYFPREVLPIAYVTSQLINMLLSYVVIFAVIIVTRHGVNWRALCFFPLIILVEYVLALGVTMLVSAVTVFLRDMEYVLNVLLMGWQYVSPVLYGIDFIDEKYRSLYMLNPMAPILIAYRDIFYYKQIPQLSTLIEAVVLDVGMLVVGFAVFERLKRHFSEEM